MHPARERRVLRLLAGADVDDALGGDHEVLAALLLFIHHHEVVGLELALLHFRGHTMDHLEVRLISVLRKEGDGILPTELLLR